MGGGHGHVTRTLNLVRHARNRGSVEALVLCPSRCLVLGEPMVEMQTTDPTDRASLALRVARALECFRPDLLVVDTFPRGILGEMGSFSGLPKILVTRWVNPAYYNRAGVADTLSDFSSIFWTERKPSSQLPGDSVEPIVDPRPLLSRQDARHHLGLPGDRPVILAIGTGPAKAQTRLLSVLEQVGELRREWCLCWYSQQLGNHQLDLGLSLKAADVVVSAAGYNAYYEIVRAGVPVLFLPQERKVDNQFLRARGECGFRPAGRVRVATYEEAGQPLAMAKALDSLLGGEGPETSLSGGHRISDEIWTVVPR